VLLLKQVVDACDMRAQKVMTRVVGGSKCVL